MNDNLSRVIEIDINEILPNRFQPRIKFDEEEILELSDSIKEHGVIQPIVVRPIGDKYEIIAGERRYKASVLAGKETVPVIVRNLNDKDSAEIALIENIQRKNLTPIEEALSYKKILDMGYITQENLAVKLGKSQPAVANKIRLLNLSDEVQEALLENKISERHARSLLKLSTSLQQNQMLDRIINERLTVRRTDEEIDKVKNNTESEVNSDSQKIIEKGEINMNKNMFGNFNIQPESIGQSQYPVQPESPGFDIFGGITPQSTTVESQEQPMMSPNFDIFAPVQNNNQETVVPINSFVEQSQIPIVQSNIESPEVPVTQQQPEKMFDFNLEPAIPTMPSDSTPKEPIMNFNFEIPKVPEQPEVSSEKSEFLSNNVSEPFNPQMISVPPVTSEIPSVEQTLIPEMQPIIEPPEVPVVPQQIKNNINLESINNSEPVMPEIKEQQNTVPEFKIPEPIIITDYSKQYDPIMPLTPEDITPTVDFKEVINSIRECSSKIEQYGFKIEVEEYDLTNLYQVIFKIEK